MCIARKDRTQSARKEAAPAQGKLHLKSCRSAILPLLIVLAGLVAGCSVHPIPDDVVSIKTEDIVRYARCEMRMAVVDQIKQRKIVPASATEDDIAAFSAATYNKVRRIRKHNEDPTAKKINMKKALTDREFAIKDYLEVAAAYEFEFDITEDNKASAEAGFKLPFTAPSVLDVGTSTSLHLIRQGKRTFKAGNQWVGLITSPERCKDFSVSGKNIVYPLGGSIGVDKVVATFMDLIDQGGTKESFVDTLIFTTEVDAETTAAVKLNAVPHSFRLVSAGAALSAARKDMHKMTLSLVFPRDPSPRAITGVDRYDGDLNAPFDRPALWRARYNLCVADARNREEAFKTLRQTAPEIYCIQYADAFAPQYGPAESKQKTASKKAPTQPGGRRLNYIPSN
jgi:hypothetical protein